MAVLDVMAQSTSELGVIEISKAVGLAPSTTHRLLATLVAGGLVERQENQKYRLGVKLIALGYAAQERLDLRTEAVDVMRDLAQKTRLTTNLAKLDGADILYIEKIADTAHFALNIRVGQRRPAYCRALGKVLLAHLPPDEVRQRVGVNLPRRTPQTITDVEALLQHLAHVRHNGYAVDREEAEVGCICLAAPIRDAKGEVIAALSVSGPSSQMLALPEAHLAAEVIEAANRVSARLGYQAAERYAVAPCGARESP